MVSGTFRISPPLIKPSRLTVRDRGGVGKGLSTGWTINFLIGCSFGCKFCYVDEIHKKYSRSRVGELVMDLKAILCPEHGAYAVVGEFDNGYYRNQWVESVHTSEEEAYAKAGELNRLNREDRLISGFQPKSYFTTRIRNLLNQRSAIMELEEDVEESW